MLAILFTIGRVKIDIFNHVMPQAYLELKLVPASQVLLGTDFPFRRAAEEIAGVTNYGCSPKDLLAIERDNALRLLSRPA